MTEKNPQQIEKKSMEIIDKKINNLDCTSAQAKTIKRVVHATAAPELAEKVTFSPGALATAIELIQNGANIITDVNMLRAGINERKLSQYGGEVKCFIAEAGVRKKAETEGVTRSIMSMRKAVNLENKKIFAIGNAPTALFELIRLHKEEKKNIDLVVGTPVGFVGAAESKAKLMKTEIPHISLAGNRGGSAVAVSIINSILYMMEDKENNHDL